MIQKILKPPMLDAHICSDDNNTHFLCPKSSSILTTGTTFKKAKYRTLLQFDLSTIPFFANITSGTLNVFVTEKSPGTTGSLGIFQVLSEWDPKAVTWNNQPLISPTPIDTFNINSRVDTLLTFNILPLLQDWFTNRSANFGIMLKFMDESCCNSLGIPGKNYHDSRFWPYLELNILNTPDHVPQDRGALPRATLDQSQTVVTEDVADCYSFPISMLTYDYTYLVANIGANGAVAKLQISPDNTYWEEQSAITTIDPGTVVSFVPDVIAKYARLCYESQIPLHPTTLIIYLQGR